MARPDHLEHNQGKTTPFLRETILTHRLTRYLAGENRNILAIANISQGDGRNDLDHAGDKLLDLFRGKRDVLIFPHAAGDKDASAERAKSALQRYGVISTVRADNLSLGELHSAAVHAEGAIINGGNTYEGSLQFFKSFYEAKREPGIPDIIYIMAANGVPITGWSAGPMLMADKIGICEDPLVEYDFEGKKYTPDLGLGIFPTNDYQESSVFPHYEDGKEHMVEDYLKLNPSERVFAMKNGSAIFVSGRDVEFMGESDSIVFSTRREPQIYIPGTKVSAQEIEG